MLEKDVLRRSRKAKEAAILCREVLPEPESRRAEA